jgi:hypothetical protein
MPTLTVLPHGPTEILTKLDRRRPIRSHLGMSPLLTGVLTWVGKRGTGRQIGTGVGISTHNLKLDLVNQGGPLLSSTTTQTDHPLPYPLDSLNQQEKSPVQFSYARRLSYINLSRIRSGHQSQSGGRRRPGQGHWKKRNNDQRYRQVQGFRKDQQPNCVG